LSSRAECNGSAERSSRELTPADRKRLFRASLLAFTAAGFGVWINAEAPLRRGWLGGREW